MQATLSGTTEVLERADVLFLGETHDNAAAST
jgi:hypothetical protein